jgi:hypothetical protein
MGYRASDSFAGTVDNDAEGARRIELARAAIGKVNAQLRAGGSKVRYRVSVKGRLGKDNPHAHLYRLGAPLHRYSSQDIRPEHSTRFDVYVYRRYS